MPTASLISDQVIRSENKIPVLGDIPILGVLFRREGKQVMKTNLLVVLTPHIIHDEGDLRRGGTGGSTQHAAGNRVEAWHPSCCCQ